MNENAEILGRILKKYVNPTCQNLPSQLCSLRILINMFSHPTGESLAIKYQDEILPNIIALGSPNLNKSLQVSKIK